jgi:hypothetical protein
MVYYRTSAMLFIQNHFKLLLNYNFLKPFESGFCYLSEKTKN